MISLFPSQQKAYDFLKSRDHAALFGEQRTGKTYITFKILENIMDDSFCGVLIGLLNNQKSTWIDKISELLPDLNTTNDWEKFKSLPNPRLFLTHFEGLSKHINALTRYKKFNWACIDEAHRISNRTTKQSRAAARLSWIKRKLILTGTPIEKQPVDLFAQFKFLAPDVFGINWQEFENYYLDWVKLDFKHVIPGTEQWAKKILQQRILKSQAEFRQDRLPEFIGLIKPYGFRITKEDVGIRRPQMKLIDVPIFGEQRRVYNELKNNRVTRLGDGTRIMAELTVTQIVKLRQIASGFIYDDDENVHYLGGFKLRKLSSLIASVKKPVVVFTAFKPELIQIVKKLKKEGYSVVDFHGKIKKKDRPTILKEFQKAHYDIIVSQIRTGGVGVDMWKANTAFIYSMTHSYIDWDQAISRLDKIDKQKDTKIFVLCSKDTIDKDLYDLVIKKSFTAKSVLQELKRRI